MLSGLDKKLLRDLRRMKAQVTAVAVVMAIGVAMMVMARSLIRSLQGEREEYYRTTRFADVFDALKRAPNWVGGEAARLPGVAAAETLVSSEVTLDLPGLDEPASGNVRSLPDEGPPELNRLFLRAGRWLTPGGHGEVLVGEPFAEANHLVPGDHVAMLLNGRRQELRIAGIVLSPEFIFTSRPGGVLPEDRSYGIFWMSYDELSHAFDLHGAFNAISLSLAPGANEQSVIAALDRLLVPYGGRGAFGRSDHPSHVRVSDEIRVLQMLSIGYPAVFLSVAAFMVNAVLSRLLGLQREQIAILKAFGFRDSRIAVHYLMFALVMVAGGTLAGVPAGVCLGKNIVRMYHVFYRFPVLPLRVEPLSLLMSLLVCTMAAAAGVLGSVRRAAGLPPAQAMRPEPPASFRPSLVERTGVARLLSHTFRMAVRNLERKPWQAVSTTAGLALATAILVVPNAFLDGVDRVLDYQWDVLERDDLWLGLEEPSSAKVQHLFEELPGVRGVEAVRETPVRLNFGSRHRQVPVQGLPADGLQERVVDAASRQIHLPPEGIVISARLARSLGVRVGDSLIMESLEGKHVVRAVPLVGLAEDFSGIAAYMDLHALNRLLDEGDVITGGALIIDSARRSEFLRTLKGIPRVSWVAVKKSMRDNFRNTTAASIGLIQSIYLVFATIMAFGVVYNSARISLAERARELATLRVLGFSRREVGGVLVTELVILALIAAPAGLLLGSGFAAGIISTVNTETVRLPLVLTLHNYAYAVLVVSAAAAISAFFVLRNLNQLNLISVLKAPE